MALYKYHYIELDTKRSPRISLQNIVAGETGNRLWITVTNNGETVDMSEKSNGEFIYRVCLKIDSDLGTRRQDSAMENSGITFIEANTGDHGKINILLSKDSFTAGMNRARIEIFSKRAEDNDTLIISAEWTFRAAGNPTGENAGNVYPSLIELENELNQLVDEAEDAIEDCEDATAAANDATDAANEAAGVINTMIENIDDVPTQNSNNLVKSGGVYSAIPLGASANPLMDGVAAKGMSAKFAREDHVHPHDTSKQDVLTFDDTPTSGSNNPVKSGGIKAAIDAAVTRVGVRYITPTTLTWNFAHTFATGTLGVTRSEIDALLDAGKFVGIYSGLDDSAVVMYPTQSDDMLYFSSLIDGGLYYSAEIYDNTITIQAHRINKNLVLVKHDADWVSDTSAHGSTTLTATELRAMMPDSIFAIQIKVVNYDLDSHVITLVESFRDEGSNIIYFRTSETIDKRMYVGSMDIDGIGKGDISIDILADESPLMLHVDEITIDDDDYITSISFIESAKQIFDAVGVRPLEVIIENDDKKYHLREWSNLTEIIEAPTQTFVNKYADLTAQDPSSNQFVCLRLRAQHAPNVYAVTGDGVFNVRG